MSRPTAEHRRFRPAPEAMEARDLPAAAWAALPSYAAATSPASPRAEFSALVPPVVPAIRSDDRAAQPLSFAVAPDPFVARPTIPRSALQPGDILFTTSDALNSTLIRRVTFSAYSHAALYIGGGKIIDSAGDGVQVRNLSGLTEHSTRVGVMRVNGLTTTGADSVIDAARRQVGKGYNYVALGVSALWEAAKLMSPMAPAELSRILYTKGRLLAVGPGYFCSELVIHAFARVGVTIAPTAGDSPGGIIDHAIDHPDQFQFVGRLGLGQGA